MKIDLRKNKLGDMEVSIEGCKFGKMSILDNEWRYFPANTHDMEGGHYIAIGQALNELIENEHQLTSMDRLALKGMLSPEEYISNGNSLFNKGMANLDPLAIGTGKYPLTALGIKTAKELRGFG